MYSVKCIPSQSSIYDILFTIEEYYSYINQVITRSYVNIIKKESIVYV